MLRHLRHLLLLGMQQLTLLRSLPSVRHRPLLLLGMLLHPLLPLGMQQLMLLRSLPSARHRSKDTRVNPMSALLCSLSQQTRRIRASPSPTSSWPACPTPSPCPARHS